MKRLWPLIVAFWLVEILLAANGGASELALLEPERGCYLGAYIDLENDVDADPLTFEQAMGKQHATYLHYVGYGRPFPTRWVKKVKALGAIPCLAWEPNSGLDQVKADSYLKNFALEAGALDTPLFLRFASEMNGPWTAYSGDPALYKRKFRLVSQAMRRFAPKVALVWTVSATPFDCQRLYYPGDEYVDWVGIDIYAVPPELGSAKESASAPDPRYYLDKFYRIWAKRKPIQVSEFAAAYRDSGSDKSAEAFACEAIRKLYNSLPMRYPRVKAIYYFSMNTIAHNRNTKNYSLLESAQVLDTYRSVIASEYFLSRYGQVAPVNFRRLKEVPFGASKDSVSLSGCKPPEGPWLKGVREGAVLVGRNRLTAELGEPELPRYVIFYVDGQAALVTNRKPYTFSLDAADYSEGPHTLQFEAVFESRSVKSPEYTIFLYRSASDAD